MQQQTLLPLPEGLPTFQETLETFTDLTSLLYKAIEQGAYKASAYRDAEFPDEQLEAGFAASILRAHSSRILKSIGTDFEMDEWIEDKIPFMGMSFYFKKYHVKVLKGPSGELPGCGDSEKRRHFYNQKRSLYLIGTETVESICNVIVLWNFGPSYNLEPLRLVLPAVGAPHPSNVSAYWNETIPYPTDLSIAPRFASATSGDDGMDEIVKPNKVDEDEGQINVR